MPHYIIYYPGCTAPGTATGAALIRTGTVLYYSGCTVQLPYYLRIKNNATLLALERGPPLMNYKEAPLLQVAGRIRTRPLAAAWEKTSSPAWENCGSTGDGERGNGRSARARQLGGAPVGLSKRAS
jgi:hypothetical protein